MRSSTKVFILWAASWSTPLMSTGLLLRLFISKLEDGPRPSTKTGLDLPELYHLYGLPHKLRAAYFYPVLKNPEPFRPQHPEDPGFF